MGDRGLLAVVAFRLVPLVPSSPAVCPRDFTVAPPSASSRARVAYTVLGARAADPTDPLHGSVIGDAAVDVRIPGGL